MTYKINLHFMRVKPPPPCVLRTAWFEACEPPYFGLAWYVPFNNKYNLFMRFHLPKEDKKYSLWHAQAQSFLQTLVMLRLLDSFQCFDRMKCAM